MRGGDFISGWGKILRGKLPLLSIEITSECPLSCPGCYAYGDRHLGGGVTLTQLSDSRGETLVRVAMSGYPMSDEIKARILSTLLTLMNCRENMDRAAMRQSVQRRFAG